MAEMLHEINPDRPTAATQVVEAFEEFCSNTALRQDRFTVISHLSGFAISLVARTVLRDPNSKSLEDYRGLCLRIRDAERKAMGC